MKLKNLLEIFFVSFYITLYLNLIKQSISKSFIKGLDKNIRIGINTQVYTVNTSRLYNCKLYEYYAKSP